MAGQHLFERFKTERWSVVSEIVNDSVPESLHLEFKTKARGGVPGKLHDDDKKNLAKTISAFANTEGGCIIFGISTPTGGDEPYRATGPDPIAELGAFKAAVEAILKDVVNPSVLGVQLEPVEEVSGSDRGVLAIYVPQSLGLPHRANMGPAGVHGHYFQRSSSRSDIMPHAMLSALFGRPPEPRLQLKWTFSRGPAGRDASFVLDLVNGGRGAARQPAIRFQELQPQPRRGAWNDAPRSEWIAEIIYSAGLAPGWTLSPGRIEAHRGTFMLQTGPEAVVYPGDSLAVVLDNAWLPGVQRLMFDVRAKGALFALDAQPVPFEEAITCKSWYDEVLMPRAAPA